MITLTSCSIMFDTLAGVIYLCPCRYPFATLRKGTINKATDTVRITKVISPGVLPPVVFPKIKLAI